MIKDFYLLEVKRPISFIAAILDRFSGNSTMSLEGDLSFVNFAGFEQLYENETAILKRQTSWPTQDFVIFFLTPENISRLKMFLSRIGIKSHILHIQIESEGELVFGCYDQFSKELTWISAEVGDEFVKDLLRRNIIRKYKPFKNKSA